MLPDFNRLKVFYYIYRRKSVVSAAQDLFVTQSAVSQSLANLEAETGQQLFVRLHGRIVPTQAAHSLYAVVAPFVRELEEGMENLASVQEKPSGVLRIGAPVQFGSGRTVERIAGFNKLYPAVRFELRLGHPSALIPLLYEGELDFVFADMFSGSEQRTGVPVLDVRKVADEEIILACSAHYYRSHLKGFRLEEKLPQCSFIDYSGSMQAVTSWFKHHYRKVPVLPGCIFAVESVQAVINAIKHGLGVGSVPGYLLEAEIKSGRVVHIKTGRPEIVNTISLARLAAKKESVAEKFFKQYFFTGKF